ncbi:MAG: hypothetical protein CVV39_07320, partial [Planctomycetes bacterium HGW-Planctomycetes-1]
MFNNQVNGFHPDHGTNPKGLHLTAKDRKIVRWIIIIIIAVILWFLYNWGGNLLRPVAVTQIRQLTGAKVDIDSVVFRLSGRVSIRNIRIGPTQKMTPDNAILTAEKLEVSFAPTSFLKLKPQLKSLKIEDYSLNIQYNGDEKQWNVAALKPPRKGKGELLPELKFKNGRIKFTQVNNGIETETVACDIEGGNAQATSENGIYLFTITEIGQKENTGNRIKIKWAKNEIQDIEIEGYLPNIDMMLFGSRCDITGFYSKITSDKKKITFKQATIAI